MRNQAEEQLTQEHVLAATKDKSKLNFFMAS
jgi:hypothetical protein